MTLKAVPPLQGDALLATAKRAGLTPEELAAKLSSVLPGVVDKLEQARTVVLQTAPQFATDPVFLQLADGQDGQEGAIQLLYCAAAFLLRCGMMQRPTVNRYCSDRRCTDPCSCS